LFIYKYYFQLYNNYIFNNNSSLVFMMNIYTFCAPLRFYCKKYISPLCHRTPLHDNILLVLSSLIWQVANHTPVIIVALASINTQSQWCYIYPTKMMPHEVVQHSLGHASVSEVSCIKLLVTPLNPSSLSRNTIDEAKSFHLRKSNVTKTVLNDPHINISMELSIHSSQ
jgi:hypothetical protein